jgi:hypothetical protein
LRSPGQLLCALDELLRSLDYPLSPLVSLLHSHVSTSATLRTNSLTFESKTRMSDPKSRITFVSLLMHGCSSVICFV